jgi:excinuclease ABC subunit A
MPEPPSSTREPKLIRIRGARTHNLANVSLDIPRDKLIVVTGLSGSGKSSLAFDTIYAEGQRRYVESLSAYARQFLGQMLRPDVDEITGLPPTLAIAQQAGRSNPRSTVATATEIYDFLRLLFARLGTPHCPQCGRPIFRQTVPQIVDAVLSLPEGTKVIILAPLVRGEAGDHSVVLDRILSEGFVRVRIDGELHEVKAAPKLSPTASHRIEAVVDRLIIKPDLRSRLTESIETSLRISGGLVIVSRQADEGGKSEPAWKDEIFSERYSCIHCGLNLPDLTPRLFSFNSPLGACPECDGLGNVLKFDPARVVVDPSRPLDDGAIDPWRRAGAWAGGVQHRLLQEFAKCFNVSPSTPFKLLPRRKQEILLNGTIPADVKEFKCEFEGVLPNLVKRWKETKSDSVKDMLHTYMSAARCKACRGSRLRPEALAVKIGDLNIDDVTSMSIDAGAGFFSGLRFEGDQAAVAEKILSEIERRLRFMIDVGIGYLTLNRAAATLSGGESQRIRLATQLGSGLVGVCYVLDEPTTGLHPRDTAKLIRTVRELTDLGNTVLIVEHDTDAIQAADWIVDVGPGAGAHGGRILVCGPQPDLMSSTESITARYLRGDLRIEGPRERRTVSMKRSLEIKGAAQNNLKKIDVKVPLGVFCCVTGVSGSGKSTLINQVLLPAVRSQLVGSKDRVASYEAVLGVSQIDKVIEIDQTPIGRTPRSNPATYTGLFDHIRELFAKTREARVRGYNAARFSFNVKGGRCEACRGQGVKRIEMHFLPDLFVECDQCKGTRYSREILDIKYRGKSIADVLAMRVEEAVEFFDSFAAMKQLLVALADVGLGYMAIGQPSTTLSGGEAQRIKLAAELGKSSMGHTLYVLDEPTSGLHFADIHRLVTVLNRLCDLGHTILVIEHNLDVIRQADWIIDLGPEGGEAGGRIVAEGDPERISENEKSHTGQYLRQ